ncbi:uncharacterized protein LOC144712631 [Wolffia australiana]
MKKSIAGVSVLHTKKSHGGGGGDQRRAKRSAGGGAAGLRQDGGGQRRRGGGAAATWVGPVETLYTLHVVSSELHSPPPYSYRRVHDRFGLGRVAQAEYMADLMHRDRLEVHTAGGPALGRVQVQAPVGRREGVGQRAERPVEAHAIAVLAGEEPDPDIGAAVDRGEAQRRDRGPAREGLGEDLLGGGGPAGDGVGEVVSAAGPARAAGEEGEEAAARAGEVRHAAPGLSHEVERGGVELAGAVQVEVGLVGGDGAEEVVVEGVGEVDVGGWEIAELAEVFLYAGDSPPRLSEMAAAEVVELAERRPAVAADRDQR